MLFNRRIDTVKITAFRMGSAWEIPLLL